MTDLEAWIKRHEGKPGAILEAAKLFGVTRDAARRAYDRVYRLPVTQPIPDKKKEKEEPVEKKTYPNLEARAELYAQMRAEGANPDEAAQGIGWADFKIAQRALRVKGINISTKAPYLLPADAPRRAARSKPVPDCTPAPAPEPVSVESSTPKPAYALIPDSMALVDKPRTLRPVSWQGKDFLYVDNGDCIEIMPRESTTIQLTRDALKQFSEELQELLEIIK